MDAAGTAELLPELFGKVGREGSQQDEQVGQGLGGHRIAGGLQVVAHGVAELHQFGDGGVELVVTIEVFADGGDGGVHRPAQVALGGRTIRLGGGRPFGQAEAPRQGPLHQPPDPLEEAELTLHIGVIPLEILLRRRLKQDEHAGRVGAVAVDHRGGINTVVLRLRHLLKEHLQNFTGVRIAGIGGITDISRCDVFTAVGILIGNALHHPLGQQAGEGFIEAEQAAIPQHLGEEARVEEVQDGVFDASHVLVHRQPAVHSRASKRQFGVVRIAVAQVVPTGAHERVHRVGLPPGRGAAAGARHVHPALELGQW